MSHRDKDQWVHEAKLVPMREVVAQLGLRLRKSGTSSLSGPCPVCGGKDRFWINLSRGIWGCRGCNPRGGDAVGLAMHVASIGFLAACELITGRPAPSGRAERMTPEQIAARQRKLRDEAAKRDRENAKSEKRRVESAREIWKKSVPLGGVGLVYLKSRGIDPSVADDQIRFHTGLAHPEGGSFPAIVARVCNAEGEGVGVWREFLKPDGSGKAPVESPKLGLGCVAGGAVRIGGIWPSIACAEGVMTALAVRELLGNGVPVWATLSTSGMKALVVPDEVESVVIYADGDAPKAPRGSRTKWLHSPGLKAANELKARLEQQGRAVEIMTPPLGTDWNDVLLANKKAERAA